MPKTGAQRSGPASNRRSSSSVYLATSGLATTPLTSSRATLIEHLNDDSITVNADDDFDKRPVAAGP
jgi:hypothetical protein